MIRTDYVNTEKTSCPKCGSKDNLVLYYYEDGTMSKHCFTPGCDNHTHSINPQSIAANSVDLRSYYPYKDDLRSRQINKDILTKYKVLVNPREKKQAYPYYKDGDLVTSAKIRTHDKHFYTIGEHKNPWLFGQWIGEFNPDKRKVLIITEGELDALAAHQMTGWASVSVPTGAQGALKDIKNNLKWVEKFDKIYICFDNDEPGNLAAEEVMKLIIAGKAYKVTLSHGKDPCEYLKLEGGYDLFKRDLDNARCRTTDAIVSPDRFREMWEEYHSNKLKKRGYSTGFGQLDDVGFTMRHNEVTTMFSDPSVGKSSIARQIAANFVRKYEDNVLYFAFEEHSLVYYEKIMHMVADGDREKVMDLGFRLQERVLMADVNGYDLQKIEEAIAYGVRSHGVQLVVFDNVTAACIGKPDFQEAVRSLYGMLVRLGKQYGHHTLAISHTKRDSALKSGTPPSMNAAFGSSGIEQFSDNVISLAREEGQHETWFAIRKQRHNGDVGEGSNPLKWDTVKGCFDNLDVPPMTYNEEVRIIDVIRENGREQEQETRINSQEKSSDENQTQEAQPKPTVKSPRELKEIWQQRVSDRRAEARKVRFQNGGSNSGGFKSIQRAGVFGENSERKKTLYGKNYSRDELQSRLRNDAPIWEEYFSRSERQLEGTRQVEVAKSAAFLKEWKPNLSRSEGFPLVAPSKIDYLQHMGGEAWDAMLQRG